MSNSPRTLDRRSFIRQAACASLGVTAMVNTMSYLKLTAAAVAQNLPTCPVIGDDDYKALVCISLNGGNDSTNMLLPLGGTNPSVMREDYEDARKFLKLSDGLHPITVPNSTAAFNTHYGGTASPLATHPNAPELAQLFNDGDLAFVCNVGTLAEPIPTRQAYLTKAVQLPSDLFSHSDQLMQWQTSVADRPELSGWGGRTADLLHAACDTSSSKVSMSISVAGVNTFQCSISEATAPFVMGPSGVTPLTGFHVGGDEPGSYNGAYNSGSTFNNPSYMDTARGDRLRAIERLLNLSSTNLLEDKFTATMRNARAIEDVVGLALADPVTSQVDQYFTSGSSLEEQLKTVTKLIASHSVLGNKRQIFFVQVGGYDIHANHLASHADLMTELSQGLMAFRNALVGINAWDKTVAFTVSDFNRTLTPNGEDTSSGTDHAWGGHAIVMGGSVAGGDLYGQFPSLKVGDQEGSIDAQQGRGRLIPSTAVDQYAAVLTNWFGADSSSMDTIFPNLHRFDNPLSPTSSANLNFIPNALLV